MLLSFEQIGQFGANEHKRNVLEGQVSGTEREIVAVGYQKYNKVID